jgi:hypothetical protein
MSRLSTSVSFACALALLSAAGRAYAGGEAAAEALFVEAKKLASQGKYAEACPKFAESNRLDRGAGTLIHLGDCYEKNKQTASAWATYKEASSAAQALGRKDWEKLASQRAAALEPRLAHLTIKVDPANPVDKLDVSRDGDSVARASWNVPIPVDVGTHNVEAKAPGFKPFTTSSTVAKDGQNLEVSVPKLEAEPAATPPPTTAPQQTATTTTTTTPADADKKNGSGRKTAGYVVAGIGVVGVAVGAVTGLMAMGKSSDAKNTCPSSGGCANQTAVDSSDSAKTLGLVSTIGFAAGGAALAAGAILIFTAPSDKKTGQAPLRIVPNAGAKAAGLSMMGVF